MPTIPTNILQNVQTYQKAELARLLNSFCAISLTNKKFKDFNNKVANLGDTVTFDMPPRYLTMGGLVINNQPSVQRVMSLSCVQAANVSGSYTDQQFIFNVRDYMKEFGDSAMAELGSKIEKDILTCINGTQRVIDPGNANYGQLVNTTSGGYRFYGNGTTAINSFNQLADALAKFRTFGAAPHNTRAIIPMSVVPSIVGSGLNQFAIQRNNEMAESWELGPFSSCDWYESNMLPMQIAGDIGNAGAPNNVMTVVSTNDPTGQNVTQITFTEPTGGTDANAINAGDMAQFNDGVPGFQNIRFLTFTGHFLTNLPVQFRMTNDAASLAGTVTVNVYPPLVWATNQNQNVSQPIVAGMQVTVQPSGQLGVIYSGDQFYLAMPELPNEEPYSTVKMIDPESGASIRHYWGSLFGQNVRSYVRDAIWGSVMVPDNAMILWFPLNQ